MPRKTAGTVPLGTGYLQPQDRIGGGVPSFGEGAPTIMSITLDLTNARTFEEIKITGTWLWIYNGTKASSNIDLRFNEHYALPINAKKGLFLKNVPFDRLIATNTAQAAETITIVYGRGDVSVENPSDNLSAVTISSGTITTVTTVTAVTDITNTVTVTSEEPATLTTTADDSVAASSLETVLAANATRKEAIIKNLAANTDNIRVGDSTNTGATRGHELKPGETIVLTTSAAIGVYNLKAGGAQSVSLVEIAV